MGVHIYGIRHHGPGSARSLRDALVGLRPDILLIEGPPEGTPLLPLAVQEGMKPPVALLIYRPDQPRTAVFYPFALFSPEWQAITYGITRGIPVRFFDLPQANQLGIEEKPDNDLVPDDGDTSPEVPSGEDERDEMIERIDATEGPEPAPVDIGKESDGDEIEQIRRDPLLWLARAAGYADGELWWEHMVEERVEGADLFEAILEAMTALREEISDESDPSRHKREMQREAYMRQSIRAAEKEGFKRIAVVCGAWHAPALQTMPPAKEDVGLLKGIPKVKVEATWVPWTYSRIARRSGYGAGINSPGWYHHLWSAPDNIAIRWMSLVARTLRDMGLDVSSAHIIESVRLAEALAAMRDRPTPGLTELNEATQTVLAFGEEGPVELIREKLIISETLGQIPDETPMVPLQADAQREARRLRLPLEAEIKQVDLDLRAPMGLDRSHLLHRLSMLGIDWGTMERVSGKKGTFHEFWSLQWKPEFAITLVEASLWGNTLRDAATAFARAAAERAVREQGVSPLPVLTQLIDQSLLADLPDAITHLMALLQEETAVASDVAGLMGALPPLANVFRYGNVRRTDTGAVAHVVSGIVERICIGLPPACASLDDAAATAMVERIMNVAAAVTLLQNDEHSSSWQRALVRLADMNGIHGLVAGRACRLLLDTGVIDIEEASRRMGLALSTANNPADAAAWVEGLLKGSGLLLLHDDILWDVLDRWITSLHAGAFTLLLPMLRRTFATFAPAERRQMGERVKRGESNSVQGRITQGSDVNLERGDRVLPIVARLLGVERKVKA